MKGGLRLDVARLGVALLGVLLSACGGEQAGGAGADAIAGLDACAAVDLASDASVNVADANCTYDDDAYYQAKDGWSAGTCFHGQPPANDAFVAPMPTQASCPDVAPDLFDDVTPPAPSLVVELGHVDEVSHTFAPYHDGDFAPIVHGVQGGIHVPVAVRVHDPATVGCTVKVLQQIRSFRSCYYVGTAKERVPTLVQLAPGVYASHTDAAAVFTYKSEDSGQLCGEVVEVRAQIRMPGSVRWGEGRVHLRLYDLPKLNAPCSPAAKL